MNSDLVTELDWDDPHAYTLNRLCTLYQVEMSGLGNLADFGYEGYADPLFEDEDEGTFTPDFLAIGPDKDAQIIDVKGFDNIEEFLESRAEVVDKIKEVLEDLSKYQNVSSSMVSRYLQLWDVDYEPLDQEIVALLPHDVYEEYEDTIVEVADSEDLLIWVLDENSAEHLRLAHGNHENEQLNNQLQPRGIGHGLQVYQGGKDIVRFARDTDRDIVRFYFIANITAHCAHVGKRTFTFEEVDDILVHEQKPTMFGHLPPSERQDIWADCIRTMRDRFELINRIPRVKDTYEWERKRFLRYPPDRHKIIQNVGEDLGILEEIE